MLFFDVSESRVFNMPTLLHRLLVLIFAYLICPSFALYGQPLTPYTETHEDPFLGNLHETVERKERDEAARSEWEDTGEAQGRLDELLAQRLYGEVFDTQLPGGDLDGSWRFRFTPKISDLNGDDYIRWPFSVRYQFNTPLEGQFDLGIYTANPIESGNGIGFYEIRPGLKYSIRHFLSSE
jgi:hypothetical protein|tara:strand:- start:3420 stop:3962 length:543 start_codon:yes stop_codon:yes gene_type:complete